MGDASAGGVYPGSSRARVAPEVLDAVRSGAAVVALESTVVAHGLPRPHNLEVARELEEIVRAGGGVPATIALLDGAVVVGLTPPELERIATSGGVAKLSTRDLGHAIASRVTGATTVAATAFLAHRAGIEVFATGGIGGVHRGWPPDVSADLLEIQRTPVLVVCAGAKSILDLPATREALETLGIPVFGWRTAEFPSFYVVGSGLDVDARVETAKEMASIWRVHRELCGSGAVLAAPVPAESALPRERVERATEEALVLAGDEGIRGKALTPYLLRHLAVITGGGALEANLALLRNNARIATQVAVALTHERRGERQQIS